MAVRSGSKMLEVRVTGFLARRRSPDILRAVQDGMQLAASQSIPFIQMFTPQYQGNLKNSYQVQILQNPRRALVTSPLSYVGVMELGRRPGRKQPPPGPIRAWVAAKLGVTGKEINRVAFLIGRKIGRDGIKIPLKVSGLGAMFARAIQFLGRDFFGLPAAQNLSRMR